MIFALCYDMFDIVIEGVIYDIRIVYDFGGYCLKNVFVSCSSKERHFYLGINL